MSETPDKRIRLIGLATGEPHALSGQWIVRYDAGWHLPSGEYDGGWLECTPDREKAARFSFMDAFALWRSQPKCHCHAVRSDGQPNRPLTAFHVEIS